MQVQLLAGTVEYKTGEGAVALMRGNSAAAGHFRFAHLVFAKI